MPYNPIGGYFPNEKSDIMNEYRGFKVGDEVRVLNENKTTITAGKIERFGDRKMGGCMEPDTMQVIIDGTKSFDMLYLVSHGLIEKLYKYSAGDVVRTLYGNVCEVERTDNGLYRLCGEMGRFTESYLQPFDGYRIGDTVWTVKRGKCKIVGATTSTIRPFCVCCGDDGRCRYPKLSNLIPTEAKYKEAMTGGFQVDIAFVLPYNSKCDHLNAVGEILGYKLFQMPPLDETEIEGCKSWADILKASDLGKIKIHPGNIWKCPPCPDNPYFGNIQVAGCNRLIEELNSYKWPMPKFKVGDAVFYKGKKWEVISAKQRTDNPLLRPHIKYDINRQITQNGGVGACVNESDLRLWKDTKFTHWLVSVNGKIEKSETKMTPRDYVDVTYLSKLFGCTDTFSATNPRTKAIKIFFGQKGDDC